MENLQDLLTQTGQENEQLKSDIKEGLNLKENIFKEYMVEQLQKAEGENKGLTKDVNNMRAVINTSAPSLEEEGTKTIENLKRKMVLIEEENIKLFNEETYVKENFQKAFQNRKDLDVVFKTTIDDLKQIILKKYEATQNFLMELNKYKRITMKKLKPQVQESVENEDTHEETQGQASPQV